MRRMTRWSAAVAVLAGAAVLVSGCGSADSGPQRDVTVVGTGQVRGAPDILNGDIGVEVTADNVSAAIARANEKAKAMTDAMVGAGAVREDVRTTDVSIQPQYAGGPNGGNTVVGYRATNSVRVVVRDLSKASGVLDSAIAAGGNETRLRSVSFAIDDNSKLLADARARAFADAKARAEQYAVLAGVKLTDVLTISEASTRDDSPKTAARDAGSAASLPLEPGTQTVTFTVKVTWGLG
ncbi:SIMPL domain-containing protein [Nocardia altamirensis]|uniref:SIMPL domain-containing protein n=1 Tax=Nocardia altamirensis TaxID=472158 RepID=UPI00083FF6F8